MCYVSTLGCQARAWTYHWEPGQVSGLSPSGLGDAESQTSLVAQLIKNPPTMWETWI